MGAPSWHTDGTYSLCRHVVGSQVISLMPPFMRTLSPRMGLLAHSLIPSQRLHLPTPSHGGLQLPFPNSLLFENEKHQR